VASIVGSGIESQLRPPSGDGSYENEYDTYCLADPYRTSKHPKDGRQALS